MPTVSNRQSESQRSPVRDTYDELAALVERGALSIEDAAEAIDILEERDLTTLSGRSSVAAAVASGGRPGDVPRMTREGDNPFTFYPDPHMSDFDRFVEEYPIAANELGATPAVSVLTAQRNELARAALRTEDNDRLLEFESGFSTPLRDGEVPPLRTVNLRTEDLDSLSNYSVNVEPLPSESLVHRDWGDGYEVEVTERSSTVGRRRLDGELETLGIWSRRLPHSEIEEFIAAHQRSGSPAGTVTPRPRMVNEYSRHFIFPANMSRPTTEQVDRDGTETRFRFHNRSSDRVEVEITYRHIRAGERTSTEALYNSGTGIPHEDTGSLRGQVLSRVEFPEPLSVRSGDTLNIDHGFNLPANAALARREAAERAPVTGGGGSGSRGTRIGMGPTLTPNEFRSMAFGPAGGTSRRVADVLSALNEADEGVPEQLSPNAGGFWGRRG